MPNVNQRRALPIFRMEMGRIVIIEEHLDHDTKKPADLRYGQAHAAMMGKDSGASCPLS
jgi:hypothetical protein